LLKEISGVSLYGSIKPFVKGITEIGLALDPYFSNALNLGLYTTMGPLT
jgi:hypothetical protein